MDESYLFRGKTRGGIRPHFVTGHYVSVPRPMIVSDKPRIGGGWDFDDIDPATVGRCTGLRDKNGKLVFEGDIITDGVDEYVVEWMSTESRFMAVIQHHGGRGYFGMQNANYREIIGNIHDNAALLESEV